MESFSTPMMKQYLEIKKQYMDCLLFYRMGDFYELFLDDAHVGSRILNITLTSRPKGKDGRIPMAGVPYHAVDGYIAKLVKAGHKVAICEQITPPSKKEIIKREVIRVVTPGTILDEKALAQKEHNFVSSVEPFKGGLALAIADISTGYFAACEVKGSQEEIVRDVLSIYNPSECILSPDAYADTELLGTLSQYLSANVSARQDWERDALHAEEKLKRHLHVASLHSTGLAESPHALTAAAALLGYLQYTQQGSVAHMMTLVELPTKKYVSLDRATMMNLELFATLREGDTKNSLLSLLDETQTAMGGRMLRDWIRKPLCDTDEISLRHAAVAYLVDNQKDFQSIQDILTEVTDIERLISRLSVGIGNARDMTNVSTALRNVLTIKSTLSHIPDTLLKSLGEDINTDISEVISLIEHTFVPEPPIDTKSGGMIRKGVNEKLDMLHDLVHHGKNWMLEFEAQEKEKSGITTLKVRYNSVFGFYIEVSKANLSLVPDYFIRKQTLVGGERFTTDILKEKETQILSAESEMCDLEYEIFTKTLRRILERTTMLQTATQAIAAIDILINFAYIAKKYEYTRPKLLHSGEIVVKKARHPVVEQKLPAKQFVPNDIFLDNTTQRVLLITGPNMAGKSVYIRSVAVIALLNQIGCFVPAESARLSIVDRIFVRSGASDMITSGMSTFMVEMAETAYILTHATENSLIVMDEIGRGTSTYDGISIAWSVTSYLANHFTPAPKTLFATHYHELKDLESTYPGIIKNYHMAVDNDSRHPIFLHELHAGPAEASFGVAVAELAGLPTQVTDMARKHLESLESRDTPATTPKSNIKQGKLDEELMKLDLTHMTPVEALSTLDKMQEKIKKARV